MEEGVGVPAAAENINDDDDVCSICHSNFHLPCQSNCSHWFCGSCILQVWDHGAALRPCKCPLCRRDITLLVPADTSSMRRHMSDATSDIFHRIERYNRLYAQHSNTLFHRIQDLPFLLKRLLRDLMDPHRSLPLVIRARVYLAMFVSALYVISPVDLIPEGVMGIIGLLDDVIIVFICCLYVAALYRALLVSRHGGGGGAS